MTSCIAVNHLAKLQHPRFHQLLPLLLGYTLRHPVVALPFGEVLL